MNESLFSMPPAVDAAAFDPDPGPESGPDEASKWTAMDVKAALRRRHPGDDNGGMVGQWTCIEEWRGVDLLALNAWQKADVVGYEVKVSRSDMRGELLRPDKRAAAVAMTTEFYFAVPAGLLTAEEIAWEEPEWEDADFRRVECTGVPEFGGLPFVRARHQRWGGQCRRSRTARAHVVRVPRPEVVKVPSWYVRDGENEAVAAARWMQGFRGSGEEHHAPCWACGGKGYLERSRVEREAPTLWVPRDVGLIAVGARGCHVVKASPTRKTPEPIVTGQRGLNDLVRWVSHRPDPRHRRGSAA